MRSTTESPEALLLAAREAAQAGTWTDAIERYEMALAGLARAGDTHRVADALRAIAQLHFERGALDEACDVLGASLAVAEVNRHAEPTAAALNGLAIVEQFAGRVEQAQALYQRAREMAETLGDLRLHASIDQNLGTLANIRGDLEGAKLHYLSALSRFQSLGDDLSAARLLNNLGMAQVDAGEWEAAEESFDRGFTLADGASNLETLGSIELNRCDLHLQRHDLEKARDHCDRAFDIFGRLESKTGLGEAHKLYGILHREMSKLYLAEMHLLLAVELGRGSGDRLLEAETERERALVAIAQGQDREALECLHRAQRLFTDLQATREVGDIERRLDRLEQTYLEIVARWSDSIEVVDPHTAGHSRRVAELAAHMSDALGMPPREATTLRVAALLHDVGKVAIPPDVLQKPSPLTPREWEIIRGHAETGSRMVAEKGLPWDVRPLVRGHHEHWDGTGYPDRLRGREIPRGARILRILDSYDALTSARSYRPPLRGGEALRIMEREVGRVLDPELFAVFRRILEDDLAEAASL